MVELWSSDADCLFRSFLFSVFIETFFNELHTLHSFCIECVVELTECTAVHYYLQFDYPMNECHIILSKYFSDKYISFLI